MTRSQVPFEETFAVVAVPTVTCEDVRSYVNVNLGRLERFIERELFFRESADQILPDSLSKEEVIDEVIARALEDGEKPERLALEPWLYRLALRAVDDLSRRDGDGSPAVPLEGSARKPNVRASDEAELQFHQPDESLTEESVIADRRIATPEDIASSDELIALVQVALLGSKPEDREALILHAIEGFTVEEIAAITDRQSEAVRHSITAARNHVRAAPLLSHRFSGGPLQSTGTD
jgi:RNA polymerase sigma factor (sigma-70 family)